MDGFRRSPGRVLVVRRPAVRAVVVGSSQDPSVLDAAAVAALGLTVLRRRSGGGVVLLEPGETLWVDSWVPRGDPLFSDDVLRGAEWVGEWWARSATALGVGGAEIHRGACTSLRWPWARSVCFAGTAAGEVSVGGRKVVGVSQWRCRQGALFQSVAYGHWEPDLPARLASVLSFDPATREEVAEGLRGVATGLGGLLAQLEQALVQHLPGGAAAWAVEASDPW